MGAVCLTPQKIRVKFLVVNYIACDIIYELIMLIAFKQFWGEKESKKRKTMKTGKFSRLIGH